MKGDLVMPPETLTVIDDVERTDVHFLDARLYEFNMEASGHRDGREIGIFLRDDAGRIMAGLYGWTWGGTCFIDKLWIDTSWRGRGLGTRLMQTAEAEARARGAAQIVLATHSFQAPGFYAKLGFERVATIDEYPKGFQDIFMKKALSPRPGDRRDR
jgi:ribosomal protein S18 acetylase RimI-like enzyme